MLVEQSTGSDSAVMLGWMDIQRKVNWPFIAWVEMDVLQSRCHGHKCVNRQ